MGYREMFANTINELGQTSLMANECERFGMTWGCREDCPALNKGKCEHWKDADEFLESEGGEDEV